MQNLRDMLADVLSRPGSQPSMTAGSPPRLICAQRTLLLVALTRCAESMAVLAPLKVTAGSGVLGAVPLLLAEAAEDDVVQLAAVDLASAVMTRRESVPIDTPEGREMWALVGQVLEAAAGSQPPARERSVMLPCCFALRCFEAAAVS